MRALSSELRKVLERGVLEGRRAAEVGVRAALGSLGVESSLRPDHLGEGQARLRVGLQAKKRQLGGDFEVLVWECAYEQWHRLLFARFLIENGLLRDPEFGAPVTLEDCAELAEELGEPDGWAVAGRFAAEILPGIFRLDDPCVRVRLAPEHRLGLERVVEGLPAEVFAADDSLGWVYQYWQAERKDAVNASEVKIGGADLGPVTQLFTENYMVRFLLENSLGAWWAARHPDSPLVRSFDYLRFDDEGAPAAGTFDGWPESVAEVTVMDPCCGSGHFLVEAFGMLWRMRAEEEGLDPVAAQDAVLADNLFGLELDPRCVQIAMFAVALTAWKQGGGWRELPVPNIACSGIPAKAPLEEWTALADGDVRLEQALERLHTLFKDADTFGSLIDPKRTAEAGNAAGSQRTVWDVDFNEVAPLLERATAKGPADPAIAVLGANAAVIARAAGLLSRTYSLIATNVPYLGITKFSPLLRQVLDRDYPNGRHDLGYCFVRRWSETGHRATAIVVQSDWLSGPSIEGLRRFWLEQGRHRLVARLGYSAFETGLRVNPALSVLAASPDSHMRFLDVRDARTVTDVRRAIVGGVLVSLRPTEMLSNPGAIVTSVDYTGVTPLGDLVQLRYGLSAGDSNQFERQVWEVSIDHDKWEYLQTTSARNEAFSGRTLAVLWEREQGRMAALAESVRDRNHKAQQWRSGKPVWGRSGIVTSRQGNMHLALYSGERFSERVIAICPKDNSHVGPLWCFAASGELEEAVRQHARNLSISPSSIGQIPFDLERWKQVAARDFPDGLPEPWSEDPTQWLFDGHPKAASEPLQVGVARLVGYHWPEQPALDGLESHVDDDGIVCLPPVGGEPPGHDRLTGLLTDAFKEEWSSSSVRTMLEASGSKKTTLADWLRDDFFKHHCKFFANRPFVWHIWDGRKDGFAALVNYHQLDRAGLEKLTYTYLGQDWIERQAADALEGVTGADVRLAAARELKRKLELVLEGEPPYDIYVRWKKLHEQPIGWEPDLDDGVRLNIRPFVEAGVLRSKFNIHWRKDRGKNPDGSDRHNDLHFTRAEKLAARQRAGVE